MTRIFGHAFAISIAITGCAFAQESNQYLPLHAHIHRLSPDGDIIISTVDSFDQVRDTAYRIKKLPPHINKCLMGFKYEFIDQPQLYKPLHVFQIPDKAIGMEFSCPSLAAAEAEIQARFGRFVTLWMKEDRMPPLTVSSGQSVRVNIVNDKPDLNGSQKDCDISISFIDTADEVIGPSEHRALAPRQMITVISPLLSGVVRSVVALNDPHDRDGACAIRSTTEVYELSSKRTNAAITTNTCLGAGGCGLQ